MIVKTARLALTPAAAFDLFTRRISEWWPPDRRHTGDAASQLFLLESGRFYERAQSGQEVELGQVRAWEPPRRILLDFFIATGSDHPTEVEITFLPQGSGTEVTVTHRPKPASAELWTERAPRYARSWDVTLTALTRAAG